jgi:hypothetical protein
MVTAPASSFDCPQWPHRLVRASWLAFALSLICPVLVSVNEVGPGLGVLLFCWGAVAFCLSPGALLDSGAWTSQGLHEALFALTWGANLLLWASLALLRPFGRLLLHYLRLLEPSARRLQEYRARSATCPSPQIQLGRKAPVLLASLALLLASLAQLGERALIASPAYWAWLASTALALLASLAALSGCQPPQRQGL